MAGGRRLCQRELEEERRAGARRRHDAYVAQYRLSEERLAAERRRLDDEARELENLISRFHRAMATAGYPGSVPVTVPDELRSEMPGAGASSRGRFGLGRARRHARSGHRAWILSMPFERRRHPLDPSATWHRFVLLTDGRLAVVRDEQKEHLEALARRLGEARVETDLRRRGSPARKAVSDLGRAPLVERAGPVASFLDEKDLQPAALTAELQAIAIRQSVALSES